MQRLALGIEYAGTNYSGWQSQLEPNVPSIQAELEKALSYVAAHTVTTVCAGRTDAGVHATGQVVHCDVEAKRSMHSWVFGANTKLPKDIRVLWAVEVPADFDARRSALQRHYTYIVYNNPIRPSVLNNSVSWHHRQLDEGVMHTAAQDWIGEHDFSSFRAVGCQSKSPVRDLNSITVKRRGELVIFDILANAFLYHMIRNMVGVLFEIGSGRKPVQWAHQVLLAKDRKMAGVTAPPHGLYLAGVKYPARLEIPHNVAGLWFFDQG